MHDDFATLAHLTQTRPGKSIDQLTTELERARAEMDERFTRLGGDRPQRRAPLTWCVDETHAALHTPLDPALRARITNILSQGRTVNLDPWLRP